MKRRRRISQPIRALLWLAGILLCWPLLVRWAGLALLLGYLALVGWACKNEKEGVMLS
jgi:hypothetical protein